MTIHRKVLTFGASPADIRPKLCRIRVMAGYLAMLLALNACQSGTVIGQGDGGDGGGEQIASFHGRHLARLRPLDLTLEPGVPFSGCLVIESVKLGDAEARERKSDRLADAAGADQGDGAMRRRGEEITGRALKP